MDCMHVPQAQAMSQKATTAAASPSTNTSTKIMVR